MIDKEREERQLLGINKWFTTRYNGRTCWGILDWYTGVGKTYGAILCINRIERQKHPMYLVVVPSDALKKQWDYTLSKQLGKGIMARIVIKTKQELVGGNILYKPDVLIVDEIHEYTEKSKGIIDGSIVQPKALLGLTASADDDKFKTILAYVPIVDKIGEQEAKEKGFIADFIEYNLSLSLSGEEQENYKLYTEEINKQLPKFKNDIALAQRCINGGDDPKTKKHYAGINWCIGVSHSYGWRDDLNYNLSEHRAIIELWTPNKVLGYAVKLLNAVQGRKALLQTCYSKYEATIDLLNKFDKVKTIVFSESTSFADKLYDLTKEHHKVVKYHSNLKTIIEPSPKTGKPIKIGNIRQRKEAVEAITKGKARVIFTAKSLDRGFDVNDLRMGITTSGTQKPTQYKQRGGRLKRKEVENIFEDCTVLLINLYVKNTQDEKWLRNRQKNVEHNIIDVDHIDDIEFAPQPNIEYMVDV